MSDRRFDTLAAFALVAGIILVPFVLYFVFVFVFGGWIIQKGFTTDIPHRPAAAPELPENWLKYSPPPVTPDPDAPAPEATLAPPQNTLPER
jgi:hypothetical protein